MKLSGNGVSSLSIAGESYQADEDGIFDVPDSVDHVELSAHGLTPWSPDEPRQTSTKKGTSQKGSMKFVLADEPVGVIGETNKPDGVGQANE